MSDQNSQRVAAVVVTYNRVALLQVCIAALRAQTHPLAVIIVINNSSTDGTGEWLATQQDLTVITQENKGGALGFYTGMKTAMESGYDWIWCMDDDGHPALDAMQHLMHYSGEKPCVMNALVLDKDHPENIAFRTGGHTKLAELTEDKIYGAAAFFNGSLFHIDVVRKVGLPLKDLTLWGDEMEYFNRIVYKHGLPIFTVRSSHHYHPAQYSAFYKCEWDVKSDWKVYFFIRNKTFVYASQYQNPLKVAFAYNKFLLAFLATIFVYQKKDRWKKVKLLRKASVAGTKRDISMDIKGARALVQSL